jgi:parvulin-like peptidyl-prolyl isomerase
MLSSVSDWPRSGRICIAEDLFMRSLIIFLAACALVIGLTACGGDDGPKTSADVPADAIALLGETEVPRAEFDELIDRAKESYKAQDRPFPKAGTPEYNDLKTRAVTYLVQRYQWRTEAEELGIEVKESDIDKRLDELVEQSFGGDKDKFLAAIKNEGLTEEEARVEIRDRVIQEKLYEKVTEDVKVTDEDVEKYYEENKQQFTQPASRTVRHILVECNAAKKGSCAKARAEAESLHGQLDAGAGFAKLARQNSDDDSSAKIGGRIPVTKGSTVPPFDKVAFDLETGTYSEPVKTTFGWHLIKADSDVKEETVQPLAKVKKGIEDQLLQQKKNEELERWLKDVEKKYENATVYAAGFQPPKAETDTTGTGVTETGETSPE